MMNCVRKEAGIFLILFALFETVLHRQKLSYYSQGVLISIDEHAAVNKSCSDSALSKMYNQTLDLTIDDIKGIEEKTCNKSISISDTRGQCCIGATSSGGHQHYFESNGICSQNITSYNRVRDLALDILGSSPIDPDCNMHKQGLVYECDLCRVVQIVSSLRHSRIAIVGDSVQRQLFGGIECELFRSGFNITKGEIVKWKELPAPPNRVAWKYGVKGEQCFNVTLPESMIHHQSQRQQIEVCIFEHYRPYLDMKQHKQIAEMSDLMIIDYGLHFLEDEKDSTGTRQMVEYESSISALLKMLKEVPDCHLIYRETSAQHFDRIGGDFSLAKTTFKSRTCVLYLIGATPQYLKGCPKGRSFYTKLQNRRTIQF
jgi:hypothetical protein